MRESLRQNILFFQHSLAADYVFGEMRVIFCRNVLLYFNAALRAGVFGLFDASSCPGGFLCVGLGEAVPPRQRTFGAFALAARIYRREEPA
jgi:chemotaxis protein methyltransferase CheR